MNKSPMIGVVALGMIPAAARFAADLPQTVIVPVSSASAAHDWTGFYAGVFGGIAASQHDFSAWAGGSSVDIGFTGNGALAGVQVGYHYDLGDFVIGASADLAATNIRAEIGGSFVGNTFDIKSQLNYLGTVQARAGAKWDNALAYVHGGLAYGKRNRAPRSTVSLRRASKPKIVPAM
jgi:outer membrane immunogenic protein